ncbi:DUF7455 domain-containing protein [Nesterenkonia muleiensis]|uniref:DUF7455 domain-containing protein n=1 Tax=Nesterenkonia muleiensis TaxID=2282648 RepID=UPI000E764375|nr:hypothetical protein [Nesterenkonia muleiensis]
MTATTGTIEAPTTLTALDRCDRCGAQAYIRAVLTSGGALLFCNHHGRDVEPKLRPMTAEWVDESDRIS